MIPSMDFYELIRRVHDHEASEEDYARLEKSLLESPDNRLVYLQYLNLHVALEDIDFNEGKKTSAGVLAPHKFVPGQILWPATGLLLGIVLTAWLLPRFLAQPSIPQYVATLIAADDCHWGGKTSYQEGERIAEGRLHLRSGAAVMRFDGGALMFVKGGTEVELRSRSQAVLRSGHVIVKAEDQAAGFLLDTPASRVVDLGTEFAVSVESSGATEVHVLEGLVSYTQPNHSSEMVATQEVLLAAGNAVRFNAPNAPNASQAQEITLRETRFDSATESLFSQTAEALMSLEDFSYNSQVLDLDQANGGMGWQAGWEPALTWPKSSNPRRPLHFITDSRTADKSLLDASEKFPQISRRFAQPVRLDEDGIYYFSALVRWLPGPTKSDYMRQVRITLRSSAEPKKSRYTMNLPACLLPQVQRQDLEVFTSPLRVAVGDLQRWVLKIVTHKSEPDEIYFRVFQQDEVPGSFEPAWWHVSLTDSGTGTLDQVILDTYLEPDAAAFGDIRLGRSWRSVTQ